MRLVSLNNCEEGLILARPIFDENNRVLLNEGSILSESFIRRLKEKKINHLYVKSEITDDIGEVNDNISPQLRFETTQKLNDVFTAIKENKTGKKTSIARASTIRNLTNVFDRIMKELMDSKYLLNMLSHMQTTSDEFFEHSINTSLYSICMGKYLGLKQDEIEVLGIGALFHDIGKTQKTESEGSWEKHPETGFHLLRREPEFNLLIAHCAYQHHENVDGTGFPRGIRGSEIHRFAKIISVAEAFDHLVTKKSLLPHEAMEMILSRTFTRYDNTVVEAFKNSVAIYPIGVTVILNTGETGVVVGHNKLHPQRPKVRIFIKSNGQKLSKEEFYDIDLMEFLNVMIVKCDAVIERSK
ncbi:HD-GYP domain-containing protein [Robertmurraya sp. Marseille-Q9965]